MLVIIKKKSISKLDGNIKDLFSIIKSEGVKLGGIITYESK